MPDQDLISMQEELKKLSQRIHSLKALIVITTDSVEANKLQKQLKRLQWQALFYLEKIENLKAEDAK